MASCGADSGVSSDVLPPDSASLQSDFDPEPEVIPDRKATHDSEIDSDSDADSEAHSDTDCETDPDADSEVDPEADLETDPEADPDTSIETFLRLLNPEPDADLASDLETLASDTVQFTEVDNTVIRFRKLSRRKWDSPIVADLDQDGHSDIIVNEHTHFVNIYWGNGVGFDEAPTKFVKGDRHGISASDFDNDGSMNIMVAQGGGRGSKPSRPLLFEVEKNRDVINLGEVSEFAPTSGRALKLIDANTDGRPDFIYTGSPLGDRFEDGANFVHLNVARSTDGGLSDSLISVAQQLPRTRRGAQRVLVTDFDNNGRDDIIIYGLYSVAFIASVEDEGEFALVPRPYDRRAVDLTKVSNISEIDFDNDGDFDLLVTREASTIGYEMDYNERNKRFSVLARVKDTVTVDVQVGKRLQLENLQFSGPGAQRIYVGSRARVRELPRSNDLGSEFNLNIVAKPRTMGFPEDADVNQPGIYAGYLGDGVWRLAINSRLLDPRSTETEPVLGAIAPVSVVVKNVITQPAPRTVREPLPVLLLENDNGTFHDVTEALGIDMPAETTFSTVGDFNNDGWTDFMVTPRGRGATALEQGLFLNEEGGRFVREESSGLVTRDFGSVGGQTQTIDFNEDGRLDILWGNARGRWHLFENTGAGVVGNHLTVDVGLSRIKRDDPSVQFSGQAHGARVIVEACGQRMVRRVGSGGSYYSSNANTKVHFGLGTCAMAERVIVRWTDGSVARRRNIEANRIVRIGDTFR